MSKRELIGLLVISVVAMWGTEANANNTILGIAVTHCSDAEALGASAASPACGIAGIWRSLVKLHNRFAEETKLTHSVTENVEFICKKRGQTDQLQERGVTFKITKKVEAYDFKEKGKAEVRFTHDLSSAQCTGGLKKKKGSEVLKSVEARTEWRCQTKEDEDGNVCDDSEAGNTVDTMCGGGIRNPDRSVPRQELECTSKHAPVCGNEIVESGEQCDGKNLNGHTCTTQKFNGGELACSAKCTFDTSGCFFRDYRE